MSTLVALVVDDQPVVRTQVGVALKSAGITEVLEAGDANEALRLVAERNDLALVVCDLMMPDKDGVELLRDIALTRTRAAVVLMSAADAAVLRATGKLAAEHGLRVLGSLSKPIGTQQLAPIIETLRRKTSDADSAKSPYNVEDLAQALRNRSVFPFYQPVVEVASGELWAVEALARWNDAQRGLLSAGAFIRFAEQMGLARRISEVIFEQAVIDIQRWRSNGLDIAVTVNLAPAAIDRLDWPDALAQRVAQANLDSPRVIVEITESTIGLNPISLLEVATRFRLKGFGLAIDDYGNGECTLDQLKRLPLSHLKLDASLIANALHDDTVRAILESTIDLGHRLGMKVVIEGVEDAPRWALVRQLGCDYAQGYYIARPMPATQIQTWLGDWRARMQRGVLQ